MSLRLYKNSRDNLEIKRVCRTMMKAPEIVFGENARKEMRDLQEAAEFFDHIEV